MREYTVTIDVDVIEGQIFAPAHAKWGAIEGVKGFKILGHATHGACVSTSLSLNVEDSFDINKVDWEKATERPGTKMQPTIAVRDVAPGTQRVDVQGEDAAQFGKVGG